MFYFSSTLIYGTGQVREGDIDKACAVYGKYHKLMKDLCEEFEQGRLRRMTMWMGR